MSFVRNAIFVLAMTVPLGAPRAADRGNADEALALMNKAVAHYQRVGKDQALGDFTNDKADFVDRDLYVACIDQNGIWTAHGMNKALIGRDMTKVMDADGRPLGVLLIDLIKTKGEGWLDYRWPNPITKKVEAKSTFSRLIGDQICGVGIYK
jgi:signal transduction histidine kinase